MSLIGWVLLIAAIWFLIAKRRKKKKAVVASRSPIDAFVAEAIARSVAARTALSTREVAAALEGSPEPEVVGKVEELVREVEIGFERLADGRFEVRACVRFEDGSTHEAARRFDAADLPPEVKADLGVSGAARAFRRWHLPWSADGSPYQS